MMGLKKPKIILIGIAVSVVVGIIISLVVARQKAQARYVLKAREADSLAFVAMALEKQFDAMVGLGDYGIDTVWAPPEVDTLDALPPDTVLVRDTILVPTYVETIKFDTTSDFEFNDWAFGVRVKGKFACAEEYRHLNYLKVYPTYWKRPPPIRETLEIDTNLLQSFGLGIAAVNTSVGLSGRYNRTSIMVMKDLGKGGDLKLGMNVEFWRF